MFVRYFSKHTIGEVESAHKALITVKATDTVQKVLATLKKHNIISAPVVEEVKGKQSFLGIINLADLITATCFQQIFATYNNDAKISELSEEVLSKVVNSKLKIFTVPISELLGVSAESKTLWEFSSEEPLSRLLDAFSVGVHRVLVRHVRGPEGPHYTFISQTDVLRHLQGVAKKNPKVAEVFKKGIAELHLGIPQEQLSVISDKSSALTGFRRMIQRNELSALPVVNQDGVLIDSFRASDFRGVRADSMKLVLLPILEFLKLERKNQGSDQLLVGSNEKLSAVVERILSNGGHRVWVVDGEKKPISVVSLTDIIRKFSIYNDLE